MKPPDPERQVDFLFHIRRLLSDGSDQGNDASPGLGDRTLEDLELERL